MNAPRRATDLFQVAIDDSIVVYDRQRRQAHLLNRSAAAVWELCDGTRTPTQIVGLLERSFPETPVPSIVDDVDTLVDDLRQRQLLDPRPPETQPAATGVAPLAPHPGVQPRNRRAAALHAVGAPGPTFAALDHRFTVAGPAEIVGHIRQLLGALVADGPADHHYLLDRAGAADGADAGMHDGWLVAYDDAVLLADDDAGRVVDHLLWHINHRAVTEAVTGVVLHASAVRSGNRAYVFAGSMNAGKSTLVAALVRAGLTYLTDEAVPVDPRSLTVGPYPKPIGLDPGSWPLFPELDPAPEPPGDASGPVRSARALRRLGTRRWWVDPAELGVPVEGGAAPWLPLGAVFLVDHDPGRPDPLVRLDPPEALLALTGQLFNLAELADRGLDSLHRLVSERPCFRLHTHDLDRAATLVREVAGD